MHRWRREYFRKKGSSSHWLRFCILDAFWWNQVLAKLIGQLDWLYKLPSAVKDRGEPFELAARLSIGNAGHLHWKKCFFKQPQFHTGPFTRVKSRTCHFIVQLLSVKHVFFTHSSVSGKINCETVVLASFFCPVLLLHPASFCRRVSEMRWNF